MRTSAGSTTADRLAVRKTGNYRGQILQVMERFFEHRRGLDYRLARLARTPTPNRCFSSKAGLSTIRAARRLPGRRHDP